MKCNGLHMAELNKDMGLSVRMVKKFEIWEMFGEVEILKCLN